MELGDGLKIDLPRLLESRLLTQATSGAGKSWLLRRILEQTHGKVQQIVIDPEGEFATLRERFDYVIFAPMGGDAPAHPGTAAVIARRLLETGVSAIINIYDLKPHERLSFVRIFCNEIVNAPKSLWHDCLIMLDEAHIFCPEKGKAESSQAVIDLATRGRKRGYCLCLATQRIAKLNKDAAAEMLNKLIGLTVLDVDVKRSVDELGFNTVERRTELRELEPGQFFAFGPAFSGKGVQKVVVGPVLTSHPKAGKRYLTAPPEPSEKIRKVLAHGLHDIPRQAAQEIQTISQLQREVVRLKTDLAVASKKAELTGVPEAEVKRRIAAAVKAVPVPVFDAHPIAPKLRPLVEKMLGIIDSRPTAAFVVRDRDSNPAVKADRHKEDARKWADMEKRPAIPPEESVHLPTGARRILAELCRRMPAGYTRSQVASLNDLSASGGTFTTYLSKLKKGGYVEERDGLVFATDTGVAEIGADARPAPASHAEAMEMWKGALPSGAFKMLQVIVDQGETEGVDRPSIAAALNLEATGGTFTTYLSMLRRNGLIEEKEQISRPAEILFPG